ncbi:MAG: outer membrane beta-barrel protein [Bacteroidales bacterium]|nr:outer membrane beta-barrel protein [Bacteroidales bacterium]
MNRISRLSSVVAAFLVTCLPALAQNVSGTLKDSYTGEPIGFATVSLTQQGAAKPSKYILSAEDGSFKIEKVRRQTYELRAELLGYKAYTVEVKVKGEDVEVGEIKMEPDAEQLEAAKVTDVGNPIVIKKDTIEYNASSFKTTDNDMLLDLLKKLPGVEVSDAGAVTVNGKSISKITIGGKTFFLDDPQMATNNIPANVIEKVKVLQKKSEQAEFTGIDDGQEETVLDLTLQQGARAGGLIGNLLAGGGHDLQDWNNPLDGSYRYQTNLFTGKFSDGGMLALIANANNNNARGFGDLSGDMMRGMGGGIGGGGRGGITNSWMVGANAAGNFFDEKMRIGGNYANTGTENAVLTSSYQETYLDDGSSLVYEKDGQNLTNSYGNRVGLEIDHKFSENTSILFRPQLNWGHGNFSNISGFDTYNRAADGTEKHSSQGWNGSVGDNRNWTAGGFLLFRQKLGLPGRTLSLSLNYNLSNNETDAYNQSNTRNFFGDTEYRDSIVNQHYLQDSRSNRMGGRLTYTEPMGNGFYLSANYSFNWSKSVSKKDTYDGGVPPVFDRDSHVYDPDLGETINPTFSNNILNRYINQSIGADLMYQKDKLHAQLGISANPTNTHNETTRSGRKLDPYDSKVTNWAPTAMLFYDISDFENMRLFYRGNSAQPSVNQLMPVPDNSDPLNVSFGNYKLEPYFNHNVRFEYRKTNRSNFSTWSLNFNGGIVQNPIVNASWYGQNGTQYLLPVNGHNSMNAGLRGFFNSPIAKSNFSVSNMVNASFSRSNSYVGKTTLDMSRYYSEGEMDYDAFFNDHSDLDDDPAFTPNFIRSVNATDRLRLTYRNDHIELQAGGRTTWRKSWYTVSNASTNSTWSNQLSLEADWTVAKTWELESDFSYNWYNGYSVGQEPESILNASVSKTLRNFTLMLKMYDIFNQSKSLSVTDASNYHRESYSNTLGRYVMLTLTWRFGSFGGRRGPGGMGPDGRPGGRPGGGPGGGRGGPPMGGGFRGPMM